jgi:cyclase
LRVIRLAGRREFLQTLSTGAVVLLGARVWARESVPFFVEPLGGGLTLIRSTSNIVIADAADGLLYVNGGSPTLTDALRRSIVAAVGAKPIKTLINTDWHPDHTGLNESLRKQGASIIAHEYTKQYMQRAGLKAGLPTKTFYTTEALTFGGDTIELGHLGQAHTDGDIYVLFKQKNVLVAGDMLSVGKYPIADINSGGWLGGMVTATKTLLDLTNEQTKVIPGVGPAQTRAALDAQHKMLSAVRERFLKMMRQGMSADDMLAGGITKDFDAAWGDPKEFIRTAYKGMWLHVRELGGIV